MRVNVLAGTYTFLCAECGSLFEAVNITATYCSGRCRQRAYRVRKGECRGTVLGVGGGIQRESTEDTQLTFLV